MYKVIFTIIISNLIAFHVKADSSDKDVEIIELKRMVLQLSQQVGELTHQLKEIKDELDNKVDSTQSLARSRKTDPSSIDNTPVVLSDDISTITHENNSSHVLANPWWKNIELWGFGAIGAYQTGVDGNHENFGFDIKEATLFMEANVWSDIDFFIELQTNRLGDDSSKYVRTGEVYIHGRNINVGDSSVGVKFGRIDIPFGEEYLWQDAIDNPLITNSVSYPYGWDEGVLFYGNSTIWGYEDDLNWILSITDGTDKRSDEDHSDKAYNLKLYGDINKNNYLSLSVMHNGKAQKSALEFAGSHFEPLGKGDNEAITRSDSSFVNATLAEINTKHQFQMNNLNGYLALTYGMAEQKDAIKQHNRSLKWLTIEPYLQLSTNWYSLLRYSEIGTYDNLEGYHFDGKIFAGGNNDYGYDVKRFQRLAFGIGWQPNPRVRAKFEIGKDWFELIDFTNKEPQNKRSFLGLEVAVGL